MATGDPEESEKPQKKRFQFTLGRMLVGLLRLLEYLHGQSPPVFHRDIGFYVFTLPFWNALIGCPVSW